MFGKYYSLLFNSLNFNKAYWALIFKLTYKIIFSMVVFVQFYDLLKYDTFAFQGSKKN